MNRAAATALLAVVCLAVPAAASANAATTSINRHADRAALSAYATYLQSLVAAKPSGLQAEQMFASQTTATCYKTLESIATSTSVPTGTGTALTSIGNEIGADADLEFLGSASTPMAQLAATLATLHWGGDGPAVTVKRFLTASEQLMALAPSDLCFDANWIASDTSAPITASPRTVAFLASYAAQSSLANQRLTAFVKLLNTYVTSSDASTAAKIDVLAAKVNSIGTATVTAGTNALFHALGVPQPATAASASAYGL